MSQLKCVVDSYKKYFGNTANTIVEIGSRDGHDAAYLSKSLGATLVYTFEANPYCHKVINNNYPEFNNIEVAVSNFSGSATFNAVQSSNWDQVGTSSLRDRTDDWYRGKSQKINVKVTTMEGYFNNNLPDEFDVVKIDVEGCSFEVLEGFGDLINNVKVFHVENERYQYWDGQKLADDVEILLVSKGFFRDYAEEFGPNSVDEVWVNGNLVQ